MVAALAGRRVDATGSEVRRFPAENVPTVRDRIRNALMNVQVLVSSAACGADLIALEQAGELGIRRRVVLPFRQEQFRQTSVVDRPGDWGPVFDRIMDELNVNSDVVTLTYRPVDPEAYAAANDAILSEGERISREVSQDIACIVIWDGKSRGGDDLTAAFLHDSEQRGYPIVQIMTI